MAEQDARKQREFEATRTSRAMWALGAGLLLLLLVIVFVAQNSNEVPVKFLWMEGNIALGVALLLGAVLGALSVLLLGAARILQMRRQAKRARKGPSEA